MTTYREDLQLALEAIENAIEERKRWQFNNNDAFNRTSNNEWPMADMLLKKGELLCAIEELDEKKPSEPEPWPAYCLWCAYERPLNASVICPSCAKMEWTIWKSNAGIKRKAANWTPDNVIVDEIQAWSAANPSLGTVVRSCIEEQHRICELRHCKFCEKWRNFIEYRCAGCGRHKDDEPMTLLPRLNWLWDRLEQVNAFINENVKEDKPIALRIQRERNRLLDEIEICKREGQTL